MGSRMFSALYLPCSVPLRSGPASHPLRHGVGHSRGSRLPVLCLQQPVISRIRVALYFSGHLLGPARHAPPPALVLLRCVQYSQIFPLDCTATIPSSPFSYSERSWAAFEGSPVRIISRTSSLRSRWFRSVSQ
ncbi:hypothetical protein EXIGLDRAFT_98742 [Exidia glandulosa HHB12029]|uniref:Uncharacterized protein n=1 Tax=Exidia glandulosa HHB12029 TaxID=1314781 RepID=A0A165H194_EXIGL|nr:hypothetical protein EXIGLDRAFT_98742 [Exidia glandulosa HHB12029]